MTTALHAWMNSELVDTWTVSRRFKTKSADAVSLLEAIGRDCVGAVQLLPEKATPEGCNRVDCEPLDEGQIAEILRAVPADVGPGSLRQPDDDLFRISIAGAQEKTAFSRAGGALVPAARRNADDADLQAARGAGRRFAACRPLRFSPE